MVVLNFDLFFLLGIIWLVKLNLCVFFVFIFFFVRMRFNVWESFISWGKCIVLLLINGIFELSILIWVNRI